MKHEVKQKASERTFFYCAKRAAFTDVFLYALCTPFFFNYKTTNITNYGHVLLPYTRITYTLYNT